MKPPAGPVGPPAVQATFDKLLGQAAALDAKAVKRVLFLHTERITSVGDTCIRFDKIRHFSAFLNHAAFHLNFTVRENVGIYDAFLKNNPYIESIATAPWPEIDFTQYDLIFCMMYNEKKFLEFLHHKYGSLIRDDGWPVAVLSISDIMIKPSPGADHIFPVHRELEQYVKRPRQGELYLSPEERDGADDWLRAHGLQEDEDLFVVLDSSGASSKLLNVNVHFNLLLSLLSRERTRILVFDERNSGKEGFYREGLGRKNADRIIFAKKGTLRRDLCLIGSRRTRLVLGPCTGLMHGASSIYNHLVREGMAPAEVPVMIVYTGRIGKDNYNVNEWWGNAPLVHCLLLLKKDGKKELVLLDSLGEAEKNCNQALACSEYTTPMLFDFIAHKLETHAHPQAQ
jgi:hypothetical protein